MDAIMRAWPATIRIVLRHRMLCVGCPVAPFHTLADACREHHVNEAAFRTEIAAAIEASGRKL
jgi:hybrid cluster-associated redox disulfide protein